MLSLCPFIYLLIILLVFKKKMVKFMLCFFSLIRDFIVLLIFPNKKKMNFLLIKFMFGGGLVGLGLLGR